MLRHTAARYATSYGFGRVLLAVPVPWDAYSVTITAVFPLTAIACFVLAAFTPDPTVALVIGLIFALLALAIPLAFRSRGLAVTEGGILIGSFGSSRDVAAARWDQISLDSLRSYTNIKRSFLLKGFRVQRAPQIGAAAETHGVAFVGPALAAARPQGLGWVSKAATQRVLAAHNLTESDAERFPQVWASAVRRADLPPLADAVSAALAAAPPPGAHTEATHPEPAHPEPAEIHDRLTTPTALPSNVSEAQRAIHATARPASAPVLTDEELQELMMFQALAMRPKDSRPL